MKKVIIVFSFVLFVMGCKKNPLNITPDGRITLTDVFNDNDKTAAYLNSCYDYMQIDGAFYNYYELLAAFSDDGMDNTDPAESTPYSWNTGSLTPNNNPLSGPDPWNGNYYRKAWAGIRKTNVFLANIDKAAVKNPNDKARWKAEAKVLRAYYYWELIQMFGGMPIITQPLTVTSNFQSLSRSSFDSCVQFIVKNCEEAIAEPNLPWRITTGEPDRGRMTKAVAYAIESEATLFNASPLWNPDNNQAKWQQAATVSKKALAALLHNDYALFPDYGSYFITTPDISSNPTDKETIFELKKAAWSTSNLMSLNGIPSVSAQKAGCSPTQELVDAYDMKNGQPAITGYNDADHLNPIINAASGYDDQHPYKDRDPRFYATVFYNSDFYGNINGVPHYIESYVGGSDGIVSTPNVINTVNGYYLHKYINSALPITSLSGARWRRFRLAEIYLNLAEAENEANGPDKTAYDAINAIRNRAGMPDLPEGLTKSEFRERVHRERRVEFPFEGKRFWDVRRWKILDQTGKVTTGMRWTKNNDGTYTGKRIVVEHRKAWKDKFLIFPIPSTEITNLPAFQQNPGW